MLDGETVDTAGEAFGRALASLLSPSRLGELVNCCVLPSPGLDGAGPHTALLHVRFGEDVPKVDALAEMLWAQCMSYALPKRRREQFRRMIAEGDDSAVARFHAAVRNLFIDFNRVHPNRASEVGEVLAYCIAQEYLGASQVASKMSLKTAGNMPIHGLDGIHAVFNDGALTVYFMESKLSGNGRRGAAAYAKSAGAFLADRRQYLREYEIVGDLGNLDVLEGDARREALEYFDIVGSPRRPRRERFVGIVCHSEARHFGKRLPVRNDGPVGEHELHFAGHYSGDHEALLLATRNQLLKHGGNPAKAFVFFVAVPDVRELRRLFYAAMGVSDRDVPLDGDDDVDGDEEARSE